MTTLLIFALICYSTCNILIFGSIFEWFRNLLKLLGTGGYSLHKLFSCFLCLGTWVGGLFALLITHLNVTHLSPITQVDNIYLFVALNAILGSGCSWLIHTIQEWFER